MKIQQQWKEQAMIVVLLTLFSHISVNANALQSHDDISRAVKQFVISQKVPLKNVTVTLTSLNKHVRLAKCNNDLQVNMAPGTKLLGRTSLAVICLSPQWKIHVAAHIDGQVNVLIARYPIPRETVIRDADLEYADRRYSQLNYGYYGSAKLLMNTQAKRNIKAGQIISPSLVKPQKLVLRGQHVTIVAQSAGLNLRVKGKALMDGQQGQTIKVKNFNSKKLIFAKVISSGVVRVNF